MDKSSQPEIAPSLDGATWIDKGFYDVLIDTVMLCAEAEKQPKGKLQRSMIRAVILQSGVMIECAANVLVWSFFSPQTISDVDKLSPLSKIDVYLECKGKGRLDRGSTSVQRATELKKLRDRLAHPKTLKRTLRAQNISARTYETEKSLTPHLGIPDEPNLWEPRHAKEALSAAVDFLRLVFQIINSGDRASTEPPRESRRLVGVSHAAMASSRCC